MIRSIRAITAIAFVLTLGSVVASAATPIPPGKDGFRERVSPFFEANCVRCHGPKKSKGNILLHNVSGDFAADDDLERWESILEVLEFGAMPPEDEPQPNEADRLAVAKWIETGLRDSLQKADPNTGKPTTRRLTNVEFENTLRDLLGVDLKVIDDLPKDPITPYKFNNTAELLQIGPEQIDRYLEVTRRAMASAIVDPEKPEVHKYRREWSSGGNDRGLGADEVGIWGNRRNTAAGGLGLKSFPKTGAFRVRVKASAILPKGVSETPLRLVMGYALDENSGTLQVEPVGIVGLRNSPDEPQIFEFEQRIENYPVRPGRVVRGKRQPDSLHITPQNLYDDGTLNDGNRNLAMPRVVIEWIEFEAPLVDVWPPTHHTRIFFESPLRDSNPEAYLEAVLRKFMSRAYRRPATDAEVTRFVKIHNLIRPQMESDEAAVRETLAMVLVTPQFLYHTEVASGQNRQYQLASRLSYFLWASMPDDELFDLASRGELDQADVIDRQVRRMLDDERSGEFVKNFTMQWLSLEKMKTTPINRERFPRFLYYVPAGERAGTEMPYRPTVRDYMIDESIGFVAELIRRNASLLNIVDSDFAVLNQRLAAHYGVEGVTGHQLRPTPIKPEHHLGGLLTQGAMLIGNGTGTAPHPIYRAVWLREAILGDEVPPPPSEVPALSDSAGDSAADSGTIKDLLARHRQKESCNDCHSRLDPWGIPFERYNAVGRFQPLVPENKVRVSGFDPRRYDDYSAYQAYLDSINTVPVEAESQVPHGPRVDGLAPLKAYLLESRKNDIAENVIRRLLTYSIGRELTFRDRFNVEQLRQQAESNGYKLQDVLISICQSATFRGVAPGDN